MRFFDFVSWMQERASIQYDLFSAWPLAYGKPDFDQPWWSRPKPRRFFWLRLMYFPAVLLWFRLLQALPPPYRAFGVHLNGNLTEKQRRAERNRDIEMVVVGDTELAVLVVVIVLAARALRG
jgi:hypothetical protein